VTKYNLGSHIRFNRLVDECKWNAEEQVYHIKVTDTNLQSPVQIEDKARVIISAVGGFLDPQYAPELPGRDVFKGDMWHSARWNHDVSLSGKNVAVIGNGCSAVQIIPVISKDETTGIVNFCRSPHYLVPLVRLSTVDTFQGSRRSCYVATIRHWSNNAMDVPICPSLYDDVSLFDLLSGNSNKYSIYAYSDIIDQADLGYMVFPLSNTRFRNFLTRVSVVFFL
jgi:cation diffusion facilitator CzcD-associated flavoprotein CzcO